MRIGEFSKASGLSIDTLRYYDKIGLLRAKKLGNNRQYQTSDLTLVEVIGRLKACDFTLEEMVQVFQLEQVIESSQGMDSIIQVQELLEAKRQHMDEKIHHLVYGKSILDKALTKLDRVLKDPSLVKSIREE